MSGIEIAGLLLGAFPLLISALEHYRQGAEVLEDWWHIRKEYNKCKNEIKVQELAFEDNLERFLLPLIVDDDQIAALIAEPGGMKWKDSTLEDKLKSRLPKSYDLFLDTIYDIKSTMDDLKEELGLSRDAFQEGLYPEFDRKATIDSKSLWRNLFKRPTQGASKGSSERSWKRWLSRPNIGYQTHRVRFGFGRANRTKLFAEFARYNTRLRELLDTNDRSAAFKQSRQYLKDSAIRKILWKVWRHASKLHNLLDQAWSCHCKKLHRACLFLHQETNIERIEFSMRFLYDPSLDIPCPWDSEEVNVRHIDRKNAGGAMTYAVLQASKSKEWKEQPFTQYTTLNSHLLSGNRTIDSDPSKHSKITWAEPPSSIADSTDQTTEAPLITNLCANIARCDPVNHMIGLLVGDDDLYVLRQTAKKEPPGGSCQTVSLEDLLNRNSRFYLNRQQRYRIAHILASSHLQLYPSPWLHSHWSKKDIIFSLDPQDPTTISSDQPWVIHTVSPQGPKPIPSHSSRDRSLPTLGILLMELCFGTLLEDHEMRRQYHTQGGQQSGKPEYEAALDLAVALTWAQSVGGEAGETYADAVNWCLRGQFVGVRDDEWREQLFTNVVRPLQSCHEFYSMAREEWLKPATVG